ncbi:hypothetical protein ACJ41O_007652 [Fusarium nematophilum]
MAMLGVLTLDSEEEEWDESYQSSERSICDQVDPQLLHPTTRKVYTCYKEQVWFSRHAEHGLVTQWALYMFGRRYDLFLTPRSRQSRLQFSPSVIPADRFEARVTYDVQMEDMLQHHGANGFYIFQIGSTTLTSGQVQGAFEQVFEEFGGSYFILYRNCQLFMERFAEKTIKAEDRAPDYAELSRPIQARHQNLQTSAALAI